MTKKVIKITVDNTPRVWVQWIAASLVLLMSLMSGLVIGWTSPYLAKLTDGTEVTTITKDEASWVASLISIARPFGAVLSMIAVRRFGSKKAVLLTGIPHGVAWICFLINQSVPAVYVARLLNGCALGMYYSTFPLYLGEISNPRIRGALVTYAAQGLLLGASIGSLIGAYVSMVTFAAIALSITAVFILSFMMFPDSPHFLVREGRLDEAKLSLRFYNRMTDVDDELESLIQFTGQQKKLPLKQAIKLLSDPFNRKIVILVNTFYVFTQLSGVFTITLYMEIILKELRINVIAPHLAVIGVGFIGFVTALTSMYTNDHFGRKIVLAVSSFGLSLDLAVIGGIFWLIHHGHEYEYLQWLSIAGLVFYQIFICIGIIPIPNCLMSEMFPPQLKEIGAFLANVLSALCAFIATRSFQPMIDATSHECVFWFYSLLVLALFVYALVMLPETRGKSLQEIQEMLMKSDRRRQSQQEET